jgi:hypothetical protein
VVQTRSEEPGTFRPSVEQVVVPKGLLQAIRGFPPVRDVEHCGALFEVSPFDEECSCPKCEAHLVLRPPSSPRIEDVFDAVFYWMEIAKDADELVSERRQYYREEDSSD